MTPFAYHRPGTVAEAVALFQALPAPCYLAGGMDLVLRLRGGDGTPSDVIDLGRIPGLDGIATVAGGLRLGALCRHDAVARSPLVGAEVPALAGLVAGIGDPQVRNRGTLGGALAVNDPAGDIPAAALALDAIVHTDRRDLAAADLLAGPTGRLLTDGEVITAVTLRRPRAAAYRKICRQALRYALVGVMVARHDDGVRVAVTGAGGRVFRWTALETALDQAFAPEAAVGLDLPGSVAVVDDQHGSAAYRAHLAGVLAGRAIAAITPPRE